MVQLGASPLVSVFSSPLERSMIGIAPSEQIAPADIRSKQNPIISQIQQIQIKTKKIPRLGVGFYYSISNLILLCF